MLASLSAGCVAVYVVAILCIVLYGWYLRRSGRRDFLARELFSHPVCQNVDGWSVTHFLLFALLGWLYPGRFLEFLAVGAGWELVETALGQNRVEVSGRRLQLVGEQDADGYATGDNGAYWYGKESDIVVDAFGYAVGDMLAKLSK